MVAEAGKGSPSGSDPLHEEPGKINIADVIVQINDKDLDFEGIMMAQEVKVSPLRGKMSALQKNCRFVSEEVPADILAVVALAKQSLDFEHQLRKREQTLVEVEQKLQGASSEALSAQNSTLEKAEEARKCREKLEDAEERLEVA